MFIPDDDGYPFFSLEDLGILAGRRRRKFLGLLPFDNIIDQMIQEMTEVMENMGNPNDMPQGIPPELVRKVKLPDGTEISQLGPIYFGYSMTVDENGRPVVQQFGNVNPNQPAPLKTLQDKREPLVDVITEGNTVKIVVELAGVNKEEIKVSAEPNGTIFIETTGERKYHKKLRVPATIDPDSGSSIYKNGILEVTFETEMLPKTNGKQIKVK